MIRNLFAMAPANVQSSAFRAVDRLQSLKHSSDVSVLRFSGPSTGIDSFSARPSQMADPAQKADLHSARDAHGSWRPFMTQSSLVLTASILGAAIGGPLLAVGAALLLAAVFFWRFRQIGANASSPGKSAGPVIPDSSPSQIAGALPSPASRAVGRREPASAGALHWAKDGIPLSQLTRPVAFIVMDRHQGTATMVIQRPGALEPQIIRRRVNFLADAGLPTLDVSPDRLAHPV